MNYKTYEAIKIVVKKTRFLLGEKYDHRKRLNQSDLWWKATLLRDIVQVENWIDKVKNELLAVKKDYIN